MAKYTVTVNSVDISEDIERDSYSTALVPVYSERLTTLDGVDHVTLLRVRGQLTIGLNPKTAARTKTICEALLTLPASVKYFDLQRNVDMTASMTLDSTSAKFLSRCLYLGEKWNQMETISLTEL